MENLAITAAFSWPLFVICLILEDLDFFSATEAMNDLAVVAKINIALQTLQERIVIEIEVAIVDDKGIELVAWFEAAYTTKEAASRLGSEPKRL